MKILLGTTNPSKVNRFREFLTECDVEFLTLSDLGISAEPEETGCDPEANAIIKAKFYSEYFDTVICNDSGLYFDLLPLDDSRQPGLNIRTPLSKNRLDDEEMIEYYSSLIHSLGGKVLAYYLDGIAVWHNGEMHSFIRSRESAAHESFYMIDTPSSERSPGWPLDSLSLNRETLTYFVEKGNDSLDISKENVIVSEYRKEVVDFLKIALGLN